MAARSVNTTSYTLVVCNRNMRILLVCECIILVILWRALSQSGWSLMSKLPLMLAILCAVCAIRPSLMNPWLKCIVECGRHNEQ